MKAMVLVIAFSLFMKCNIKEQVETPDIPDEITYEKFTVVVLPDTQIYSKKYPDIFTSQTEWIVDNKEELNIKFVIHLGDVVNDGYSEIQWNNADTSMSLLDGVVSYLIIPGNHDYESPGLKGTKDSMKFNTYFPYWRFDIYDWYGGHYPKEGNDNSYGLFEVDDKEFLVIGLEFCPTDEVIEWSDNILKENEDKEVILFTHAYLNEDNTRINTGDWSDCSNWEYCRMCSGNNGETIWNKLVSKHSNIIMVLCGHIAGDGLGRRTDYVNGKPIYQILQNYQMLENGGNGYLRLYEFDYNEKVIKAITYSPYLDEYKEDEQNKFELLWR